MPQMPPLPPRVGAAERPHQSIEEIEDAAEAAAGRWRARRQGVEPGAEAVFEFGALVAVRVVDAVHGGLRPGSVFEEVGVDAFAVALVWREIPDGNDGADGAGVAAGGAIDAAQGIDVVGG